MPSARPFLCGFAFAALFASQLHAADPQELHVYFGTYTQGTESKGIYHARLNLASGELSKPEPVAEAVNPSFLAIHPQEKYLYAVNEIHDYEGKPTGGVTAFELDKATGKLTKINSQPAGGTGPCHLNVDRTGNVLLVANYGGGSVASFKIEPNGGLTAAVSFIQHTGSSADAGRQKEPHAHSVNIDPANRFAFVADLGLDKVLVYKLDADRATLFPNDPPSTHVDPGSGPRHFAFRPDGRFAYVINEMKSTITALQYHPAIGTLGAFQSVSTLPADFTGGNSTAEIVVHPSGKFLYGSNRGHNSLAIFQIDPKNGTLTASGHQLTGGRTPRNFAIDPTGQFLIAENQDSDNVQVFRIGEAGALTAVGGLISIPKPVCARFVSVK